MDQYGLLSNNASFDDQSLETDVMRFLAIIGIVLWIVFSMVESIPSQSETKDSSIVIDVIDPGETPSSSKEESHEKTIPATEPEKTNEELVDTPKVIGVSLEFESLAALIQLLRDKRLTVYARTWGTGFDLVLQGAPEGDAIRFKKARKIPNEMWEIKETKARKYFIQQMIRNFPSIKTFPEKSIRVAFVDKALEQDVINKMEQLRQEDQNGVLSLTAEGTLIFSDLQKSDKYR